MQFDQLKRRDFITLLGRQRGGLADRRARAAAREGRPRRLAGSNQFGTPGDYTKSEYSNHYTLSGVYFPGQYMCVRWRPKKSATKESIASP